jgi:hypothetical protein
LSIKNWNITGAQVIIHWKALGLSRKKIVDNKKRRTGMEIVKKVKKALKRIEKSKKPLHPFELFGIEHGYGWLGLTLPIIEEIRRYNEKNPENEIYIYQIKQKWGHLEIYITGAPDYLEAMIRKASGESEHICETCGARGELIKFNGWYITLCKEHIIAKEKADDRESEKRLYKELVEKNYGWKSEG